MPDLPRVYWDACVFLSYVNGIPERLSHLDPMLAKSGKAHQLVTSTMSVVEVAFAKVEQDNKALDADTDRKISGLWAGPAVILVEFFPLIAMEARQMIREALPKGWALKPMDAIHLATAKRLGALEFHTYDDKLLKYAATVGLKICEPIDPSPELALGMSGQPLQAGPASN